METKPEGLLKILRREPDLWALLVKLVFGGPIAILAWDRVGSLVLAPEIVTPVTGILILTLVITIAYFVGRTVRESSRFQVESTLHAQHLMSTSRRALTLEEAVKEEQLGRLTANIFDEAYFRSRLNDEVNQARIEGHQMSVLSLHVSVPGSQQTPESIQRLGVEMARLVAGQSKLISHSLGVGDNEFVFSLPRTDAKEAKSFVSKIVNALGEYWCEYGIAVFPVDATSGDALYTHARHLCEESRFGKREEREAAQTYAEPRPA